MEWTQFCILKKKIIHISQHEKTRFDLRWTSMVNDAMHLNIIQFMLNCKLPANQQEDSSIDSHLFLFLSWKFSGGTFWPGNSRGRQRLHLHHDCNCVLTKTFLLTDDLSADILALWVFIEIILFSNTGIVLFLHRKPSRFNLSRKTTWCLLVILHAAESAGYVIQ